MEATLYYFHLMDFLRKHGIPTDLTSRLEKLKLEVQELDEAIASGDPARIVKEAADCLNVTTSIILLLRGNPLWEGYLKLKEAAGRPHYIEMARKVQCPEP